MRLPPHQIRTTGATGGDVLTYDPATDEYGPAAATGGGGGTVDSVVAGTGISVDSTDPANPIVSATGGGGGGGGVSPRVDDPDDVWWTTTTGGNLGYDTEFDTDDTSGALPSGWSWVNQKVCTYKQYLGAGSVDGINSVGNVTALVRAIPTQTAWTATAKVVRSANAGDLWAGLCVRTSSSGKLGGIAAQGQQGGTGAVQGENGAVWNRWNGPTTFGATYSGGETGGPVNYLRIVRTSTTWEGLVSMDGVSWLSIGTANLTTDIGTPDQIGFYFGVGGGATGKKQAVSLHWLRIR